MTQFSHLAISYNEQKPTLWLIVFAVDTFLLNPKFDTDYYCIFMSTMCVIVMFIITLYLSVLTISVSNDYCVSIF